MILFAVVLSFTGDVIGCGSKSREMFVVPFECVLSVTVGVFAGGVVSVVGMVAVTTLGRLVEVLFFNVSIAVCASSGGNYCGVLRKGRCTYELPGFMLLSNESCIRDVRLCFHWQNL